MTRRARSNMYIYQKTNRYFAQVAEDLKDIAEKELRSLGARDTKQGYRGVYFSGDIRSLYCINLHCRLINRVLAPLVTFGCYSDQQLYKKASQIHWEDFLDPSFTFAVFATVSHSVMRHSKFAALRLKDAIADYFRGSTGQRPSVDTRTPDVWISLYVENNQATISLDTSGGSLHKRSYRRKSVEAPMIETLAAAIIEHADWDGNQPLYDPFCGSGTLLCEAYLRASETPPAILRSQFGFERLPEFDAVLWNRVRKEGMEKVRPVPEGLIRGSDVSSDAVNAATRNCSMIDTNGVIQIERRDVFDIPGLEEAMIICNPPYGLRMSTHSDLANFYKRFGDFLKQHCQGATAIIYFGEREHLKNIGLRPTWRKPLSNGGLDGRLARYELY